jgi:hypothetical protein
MRLNAVPAGYLPPCGAEGSIEPRRDHEGIGPLPSTRGIVCGPAIYLPSGRSRTALEAVLATY